MPLPAVMMAYKERENLAKLAIYAIAGVAILYVLWKIFKELEKAGNIVNKLAHGIGGGINNFVRNLNNAGAGIKESIDELRQYGWTKPLTPHDTLEILDKRASKNPNKTYYVEETIYNAMLEQARKEGKSLPKNVKPTISVPTDEAYKKVMKESGRQYFDSKLALDLGAYRSALEETKKKHEVGLREGSKAWKRQVDIEAKRWNAIAERYKPKPLPANPMPKKVLLEKLRRMEHPFIPKRAPVYKYQPLPRFRNRFLR